MFNIFYQACNKLISVATHIWFLLIRMKLLQQTSSEYHNFFGFTENTFLQILILFSEISAKSHTAHIGSRPHPPPPPHTLTQWAELGKFVKSKMFGLFFPRLNFEIFEF